MLTLTIGVPSAVKTFNWLTSGEEIASRPQCFTLLGSSRYLYPAASQTFLGQTSIDIPLHDTYFPVGRHLIMGVAAIRHLRRYSLLVPQNVWSDAGKAW